MTIRVIAVSEAPAPPLSYIDELAVALRDLHADQVVEMSEQAVRSSRALVSRVSKEIGREFDTWESDDKLYVRLRGRRTPGGRPQRASRTEPPVPRGAKKVHRKSTRTDNGTLCGLAGAVTTKRDLVTCASCTRSMEAAA